MSNIPTITLKPTGQKMPLIGFGAWKVPNATCADTIYNAIKAGYRLIDGAEDYANEKECGEGVRRAIADGIIKREDIFITSKLWNTFHQKDHAVELAKRSLADWGLEYFDLFLIHFPIAQKYVDPAERYPPGLLTDVEKGIIEFEDVSIAETWAALESLVDAGLVKNIGVSNFNAGLVRDLLTVARIRPSVLQIEHHPYLTQPALIDYIQAQGIAITGYSTFGPQSFLEMGQERAHNTPLVLEHETVNAIASAHGKSPAQVILRWATQRNIAVIPKSNNVDRLKQNLESASFDLTEEEIKQISALNINLRFNDPNDWPGKIPIF